MKISFKIGISYDVKVKYKDYFVFLMSSLSYFLLKIVSLGEKRMLLQLSNYPPEIKGR